MSNLHVPMYDPKLVQPMREELVRLGFEEMRTPDRVEEMMARPTDTTLVVVNSVCGCASGRARPATAMALRGSKKPTRLLTVFAGQDAEATARARSYFAPYPPSSPQIALFKGGKLVFMLERKNIEGRLPTEIAADLSGAFDRFCA